MENKQQALSSFCVTKGIARQDMDDEHPLAELAMREARELVREGRLPRGLDIEAFVVDPEHNHEKMLGAMVPFGENGEVVRSADRGAFIRVPELEGFIVVLREDVELLSEKGQRGIARHELAHAVEYAERGKPTGETHPEFVSLCEELDAVHPELRNDASNEVRRFSFRDAVRRHERKVLP